MYKICFNFKALFEQRGPKWVCPSVAIFDRRMVKKLCCKHRSASLLSSFFSTHTWSDFTPVFSILLDKMQPPKQLTTVMFSMGLQSKPEQRHTLCTWITGRLELTSPLFFHFCWAQDQKNAASLALEWGDVAKFTIYFPFSPSFWFYFLCKNASTLHHTFEDLSGTA